jgi:hypothetical protein
VKGCIFRGELSTSSFLALKNSVSLAPPISTLGQYSKFNINRQSSNFDSVSPPLYSRPSYNLSPYYSDTPKLICAALEMKQKDWKKLQGFQSTHI